MIKRELFYFVVCDGCRERLSEDNYFEVVEKEKHRIMEEIDDKEWIKVGRQTFCSSDCQYEANKKTVSYKDMSTKKCVICSHVFKKGEDWFEIIGHTFGDYFCMKHDDDDVEELMKKADKNMSTRK